jgi:hypothetical protein
VWFVFVVGRWVWIFNGLRSSRILFKFEILTFINLSRSFYHLMRKYDLLLNFLDKFPY